MELLDLIDLVSFGAEQKSGRQQHAEMDKSGNILGVRLRQYQRVQIGVLQADFEDRNAVSWAHCGSQSTRVLHLFYAGDAEIFGDILIVNP